MLGCIQPISSPMMNRMLGFGCCWADAGALAIETAAAPASKPSHNFRDTFMAKVSYRRVEWPLSLFLEQAPLRDNATTFSSTRASRCQRSEQIVGPERAC